MDLTSLVDPLLQTIDLTEIFGATSRQSLACSPVRTAKSDHPRSPPNLTLKQLDSDHLCPLNSYGDISLWIVLAVLGGCIGHIFDLKKTNSKNLCLTSEARDALTKYASLTMEANSEVLALQQRQFEWTSLMEEQVAERSVAMQDLASSFRALREQRESQLRGFSHDLRNPLSVLMTGVSELSNIESLPRRHLEEILSCVRNSIEQVEELIDQMMEAVTEQASLVKAVPETIATEDLPERFKRRLRALARSRREMGISSGGDALQA